MLFGYGLADTYYINTDHIDGMMEAPQKESQGCQLMYHTLPTQLDPLRAPYKIAFWNPTAAATGTPTIYIYISESNGGFTSYMKKKKKKQKRKETTVKEKISSLLSQCQSVDEHLR